VDVCVDGVRRTATAKTHAEAVLTRAALLEELNGRGLPSQTTRAWTLERAVTETRREAWAGRAGEQNAMQNAAAAIKFFGGTAPLRDIDRSWINDYIDSLETQGNSNGTINRKIAALSKVMTVAVEHGGLPAKPPFPKRKPEGVGRTRYLTEIEEAMVIDWLVINGKPDQADAVVVLIDTGLRLGELWRLETRDIDWKQGLLNIWETKSGHPRSVPMTQRVQDILLKRTKRPDAPARPFPHDNAWLRHQWDRVRAQMQLDKDDQFVPHVLRHTCASRLVQRGVGIAVVQQWLGHKTIQITMRYAHLAPANLLAAVSVLEQPALDCSGGD
jgi:integrase